MFIFLLGTVFGLLLERKFKWADHVIRLFNKVIGWFNKLIS